MKDKRGLFSKKDDSNPFAGYLYEDEKILWMSGSGKNPRPNERKTFATLWLIALTIWFIVVRNASGTSLAISTSLGCLFLIGMVYVLAALWPIVPKQTQVSTKGIYALTNRHLFYWDGEHMTEIALEDMPEMLLIPGAGSQSTITFGNVIPSMRNIDDAASVKSMIERARKRRLEGDYP